LAYLVKHNPNKVSLANLVLHFVVNMEHSHSFRYYCGKDAHDEDYIEYDVYRIYKMNDDDFTVIWYSSITGERKIDTMDWEEMTDWLDEMWN
jgi:hypothetical protein